MLLESLQLFPPFVFRLLLMLEIISPTSHILSHSVLDGPVGTHTSAIIGTMRHVLFLRNSCLLAKHAIALYTVVLVRLVLVLVGAQETSNFILLTRNPCSLISGRERSCLSRGYFLI